MNHTPGPWTVAPGRDKTHPHNIESRSPECDGFDLARCVNAADAALIAAAPDLLNALRDLVEQHERLLIESRITKRDADRMRDLAHHYTEQARAAIAKATA